MSLRDLAGQLNPGGPEAAEAEGEAEWAAQAPAPRPRSPSRSRSRPRSRRPRRRSPRRRPPIDTGEYEDVAGAQAGRSAATEQSGRPVPPSDIWETAAPDEATRAYSAISPEQAAAAAVDPAAGERPLGAAAGAEEPAADEAAPAVEEAPPRRRSRRPR